MSEYCAKYLASLVVCLSVRRGPGVFMNTAMGEDGAFDHYVFRCGKIYYSNHYHC
jgi:hypothetical protein